MHSSLDLMCQGKACATTEAGQPARNPKLYSACPALPNPAQRYPYVIPYYTSHTHATIQIHTYPTLKIFPSCLPKVEGLGLNFPPRISLHFFSSYLPVTPVHSCVPVLRSSCVGTFPKHLSLSLWLNSALIIFTFQSVPTNWFWLSAVWASLVELTKWSFLPSFCTCKLWPPSTQSKSFLTYSLLALNQGFMQS